MTAMRGPTWQDIVTAPEWRRLSPHQRETVRRRFFADVIVPTLPRGVDPREAWEHFDIRTGSQMLTGWHERS